MGVTINAADAVGFLKIFNEVERWCSMRRMGNSVLCNAVAKTLSGSLIIEIEFI